MDLLRTLDVTVLGYHSPPEQTSPDQARRQYEERAISALEDITQEFENAGGAADYRLVFTDDRRKTVHRVADETDASAIAISGATGDVDRLLVSLTGEVDVERILSFVTEMIDDRFIGVTLFVAGDTTEDVRQSLDTSERQLRDAGLDARTLIVAGPQFDALMEAASRHDTIVMGENAQSWPSLLLGDESERIASASVGPVIVVRSSG